MKTLLMISICLSMVLYAVPSAGESVGEGRIDREVVLAVDVHRFPSRILGEERTVRVAVPPSYGSTNRPYPVVYVLDGEFSGFLATVTATRFLASLGRVPEMIVVGVHNVRRESDMTPEGLSVPQFASLEKRADDFLSFFGDELFPRIAQHYRVQPIRALIGHSHGGIFGTYALAARPDLFRWHLAIDAPLYLDDYWLLRNLGSRLVETSDCRGRLVVVDAGAGPGDAWQALEDRAPADFALSRLSLPEETHESVAFQATYLGLGALFFDYPMEEEDPLSKSDLHRALADLSDAYGAVPAPSRRVLVLQGENQMLMGFGREARLLLEEAVTLYGRSPGLDDLLAEASAVEDAGAPAETVADVLATPRATAEAIGPFVGAWELVTPGEPRNLLRIGEDGGLATGSFQLAGPSGERGMTIELDVIEVLDDGRLAFGYVNNMRPKGVLYYTLSRKDAKTLSGSLTFRGVKMGSEFEEYLKGRSFEFRHHDG